MTHHSHPLIIVDNFKTFKKLLQIFRTLEISIKCATTQIIPRLRIFKW